ncbi:MAG: hypothetical protein H5U02_00390 [Clostridia bacterium]|nr:hypothetical protein [Clostridia bacterium]
MFEWKQRRRRKAGIGRGMGSEKPVIFSTEMVRAVLDGRKTQTRRVIKSQPFRNDDGSFELYSETGSISVVSYEEFLKMCPFQPGVILWVRETHYRWTGCNSPPPGWMMIDDNPYNARAYLDNEEAGALYKRGAAVKVPAIHMPRKAARLFLRVKNIRVERLQDVTEEDAIAEGMLSLNGFLLDHSGEWCRYTVMAAKSQGRERPGKADHIGGFAYIWDRINAKRGYGWNVNPWVWVIDFEAIMPSEMKEGKK